MSTRPLMIATLLGASIGVPYVVSHTSSKSATTETGSVNASNSGSVWPGPAAASAGLPNPPMTATLPHPALSMNSIPNGTTQPESIQMHPAEQVLRFDLTQDWVYRNWDRKWTGPTDVGLTAVRVSLVSGTDISSLAGALTYFFNAAGEIEHISFHGRTGNAARLVEFLGRTYDFKPVAGPTGEQVYQVTSWNGNVRSELRTRPEALVRNSSPYGSTVVELELARPGSQRSLPPRVPKLEVPAG